MVGMLLLNTSTFQEGVRSGTGDVDRHSVVRDLRLLLETLVVVTRRTGA